MSTDSDPIRSTLFLSFLAYFPEELIPLVLDSRQGKIVWGPVSHKPFRGFTVEDALAFVVQGSDGHLTLVFRGTNPFSLSSWLRQDFQVSRLVRWDAAPVAPANLKKNQLTRREWTSVPGISQGANLSLGIASELRHRGQTLVEFLQDHPCLPSLTITGHSLGGLLATTFGFWLGSRVFSTTPLRPQIYSYAAPSAGNRSYAELFDNFFSDQVHFFAAGDPKTNQKLDAATLVWNQEQMASLPGLYAPVKMRLFTKLFYFFLQQKTKGRDYQQIQTRRTLILPSQLIHTPAGDYLGQVAMQHTLPYLKELIRLGGPSLGPKMD